MGPALPRWFGCNMNINLVPSSFGSRLLAVVLSVASVVGLLPATAAANSGTVVTRNTQETAWPSIVELSMTYGNVSSRCTGSIIDAHVVLTAAHCVDDWIDTDNDKVLENIELDSVTIQTSPVTQNIGNFGTPQPDGQVRSGRGVALHPTWRPTNPISQRGVDLAVVMLDRGVIAPADPLAERNPDVSDIVWIAGWGLENAEAPSDDQLRDGRMVRADSCPSSTSQTTQFCFDEWTAMACYGDSGGPVAWFDAEAGGYRLVGVMNSVTSCSVDDIDADNPRQLIAARVTGTNRQWIDAVVVEAHRTATAPQLPAGWFTLAPAGPSGGDPEFVRGEPVAMPDSGAIPPLVDDPHYDSEIQCILAGGANCDQYRGEQVIPAPTSPAGSGTPFVDVPADSYYSDAVAWMLESGITTGTSSTTYSPNNTVTRAQMAAFQWRAAGAPAS